MIQSLPRCDDDGADDNDDAGDNKEEGTEAGCMMMMMMMIDVLCCNKYYLSLKVLTRLYQVHSYFAVQFAVYQLAPYLVQYVRYESKTFHTTVTLR